MFMKDSKNHPVACASCDLDGKIRACRTKDGRGGKGCPTLTQRRVLESANKEYEHRDVREFARQASIQEAECYANRHQQPYVLQPTKPRIVEICEFAKKMNFRRLGLAFCIGLSHEAVIVEKILKSHGLEVISVVCKAGKTSKAKIDVKNEEMVFVGTDESMCNPIFQAKLLNHEKVDFNVLLGLCVGHDSLFFKYAKAPTTVLAVKDRVMGHNPLAAVYLSKSYCQKLQDPELC